VLGSSQVAVRALLDRARRELRRRVAVLIPQHDHRLLSVRECLHLAEGCEVADGVAVAVHTQQRIHAGRH
jgi:hypothetical protein